MNEAVVPLPDGKAIPVNMGSGMGQNNNVTVNVSMDGQGNSQSQSNSDGQMGPIWVNLLLVPYKKSYNARSGQAVFLALMEQRNDNWY